MRGCAENTYLALFQVTSVPQTGITTPPKDRAGVAQGNLALCIRLPFSHVG
jgi:hypothetical protein